MKRLAFPALLTMAALAAPAAAAEGDTEVTLLVGISLLDAHSEREMPFDVRPYLPGNLPSRTPVPPIVFRERSAIGGSALFGASVARRVGPRAWIEGGFAIAPTHRREHELSLDCSGEVCAVLTGVRGTGPADPGTRETVVAYHYGLALAYELTRGDVRPYLSVGAGGASFDTEARTETEFSFDVGAGVRLRLDRGVGARLEVVDHILPDFFLTGDTEHDVQIRAGISFRP